MRIQRPIQLLLTSVMAASLIALTGCATSNTASVPATVVAAASANPELSTFSKLLQQSGLSAQLAGAGPITVFAPTDEAFKAVPAATLDKLGKDPELLKATLSYHVAPGLVKSSDINTNSTLSTVHGAKLAVSKAGDFVTVDDSMVVTANLPAGNGVIHTIDRVLTAPKK